MAQEIKTISTKVELIETKIDSLPEKMKEVFVSKLEFESHKVTLELLQKIVYGTVALILTLVLTALIALVLIP